MEHNFDEEYQEEEIIDISKYWNRLLRHWKIIFRWGLCAFVLGCVVALCTPRKYMVTSKLAPELSSTATNRLTSLASLVGMNSNILGSTDAVYPMVYPDVIKSNEFIADLFDCPVTFVRKDDSVTVSLSEYLLEHQKKSLAGMVLSVPGTLLKLFKSDESEKEGIVDPFQFTKEQWKVAKVLSKCIEATIDKKTLVVTVSVTMQDALVCGMVAREVNDNLKRYVTRYRTEKSIKDCSYYEKLHQEAQDEYYAALKIYSAYTDSHQGVSLKSYMIESERLKNEASLKYQLYNSTAQQLQAARAKVQQETPVFAEIIPPAVPFKPANSRKKMALAFGFLGVFLGAGYVLWKFREDEDGSDNHS